MKRLITKKKLFAALMIATVMMVSVLAIATVKAFDSNYYTGITINIREEGYGNGIILSEDVNDRNPDGSWKASKVIYQTKESNNPEMQELPAEIFFSTYAVGITNNYIHYITYNGIETAIPAGGEASIEPSSSIMRITFTTKNSSGVIVQKTNLTVGLVLVDGAELFDGSIAGKSPEGTAANPFVINTPEQLDFMRYFMNSYFVLGQNIDLDEYSCDANEFIKSPAPAYDKNWRGIGLNANYCFGGVLDGDGYAIENLHLNNDSFFKYLKDGTVKNVKFTDAILNTTVAGNAVLAPTAVNPHIIDVDISADINYNVQTAGLIYTLSFTKQELADQKFFDGVNNFEFGFNNKAVTAPRIGGAFFTVTGIANEAGATVDSRPVLNGVNISFKDKLHFDSGVSGSFATYMYYVILTDCSLTADILLKSGSLGGVAYVLTGVVIGDGCNIDIKMSENANDVFSGNYPVSVLGGICYGITAYTTLVIGDDVSIKVDIDTPRSDYYYVGGLIGNMGAGNVGANLKIGDRCDIDVRVVTNANRSAGLIGQVYDSWRSTITIGNDATITVREVSGWSEVGGFIGNGATVDFKIGNNANIYVGSVKGASSVGGLFGSFGGSNFTVGNNCALTVDKVENTGSYTGGVMGSQSGSEIKFGSGAKVKIGTVTGANTYVGGFAGSLSGANLVADMGGMLFSAELVSGTSSYVGGFAGSLACNELKNLIVYDTNVYNTAKTSGFSASFSGQYSNVSVSAKVSGENVFSYMGSVKANPPLSPANFSYDAGNIKLGASLGATNYKYKVNNGAETAITESDFINVGVPAAAGSKVFLFADTNMFVYNVPAGAPELIVDLGGYTKSTWTNAPVVFTLSNNSGLTGYTYKVKIDGAAEVAATAANCRVASTPFAGTTYQFFLYDPSSALVGTSEIYTVKIDATNPKLSTNLGTFTTFTDQFDLELTVTNVPVSKITSISVKYEEEMPDDLILGNIVYSTVGTVNYGKITIDGIDRNGNYLITMTDGSGRTFTHAFTVTNIKKVEAPNFTVTDPTNGLGMHYSIDFILPDVNNIRSVQYQRGSGAKVTITTYPVFTVTAGGTYTVFITFNDGVQIQSTPFTVNNIDNRVPIMTLSYNNDGWIKINESSSIAVNLTNIGPSGITAFNVYLNGAKIDSITVPAGAGSYSGSYEVDSRGVYTFEAINGAGKVVRQSADVLNIELNNEIYLKVDVTGTVGTWTDGDVLLQLVAWGDQGVINCAFDFYMSSNSGATWQIAPRNLLFNSNTLKTLIFKVETETGLSATFGLAADGNAPVVVKIDKTADIQFVAEWVNPTVPGVSHDGTATFTLYSDTVVNTYEVFWKVKGAADGTYAPVPKVNGQWVKTFEIDVSETYYTFMLKTGLNKTATIDVTVYADEETPVLDVTYDGVLGSWTDKVTFTCEITNVNKPISGVTYLYRVYDNEFGDGDPQWMPIKGNVLTVTEGEGYYEFKALTGAQLFDEMFFASKVMADSKAEIRITTQNGADYTDNITGWYRALELNLDFISFSGGFQLIYVDFPAYQEIGAGSFTITRNGTYTFSATNLAGVTKTKIITVSCIDDVEPAYDLKVYGVTGKPTTSSVTFDFETKSAGKAGAAYYYRTAGQNDWTKMPAGGLTISTVTIGVTYQFAAKSNAVGANFIQHKDDFILYIYPASSGGDEDDASKPIVVKPDSDGKKITVIKNFAGIDVDVFVSINGAPAFKVVGDSVPLEVEGTYAFSLRRVDNGEVLYEYAITVAFPKAKGISGGVDYANIKAIQDKANFGSDLKLIVSVDTKITVTRDSIAYTIQGTTNADGGLDYNFDQNGTYLVTLISSTGIVSQLSFTVDKPNIALIVSIIIISILVVAIIAVLVFLYIRQKKMLTRLIAASTVSDDSNKFVMFKKIK